MNPSKFRSFCLTFIIALAMAAASLTWLGVGPALAQGNPVNAALTTVARVAPPHNPQRDPLLMYWPIYLTDPVIFMSPEQEAEVFDRNGNPLGMGTFEAETRGPEPAIIGSLSLALPDGTFVETTFDQIGETMFDARHNPIGVIIRGQGTKSSHGQVINFEATHIVQYLPNGECCLVEILANELNTSGGVRFEAAGALRFEH
jgi:hypothetical protein